jgi:hypothetical protein
MTLDTGLELKVLHYGEILMIKSVSHWNLLKTMIKYSW